MNANTLHINVPLFMTDVAQCIFAEASQKQCLVNNLKLNAVMGKTICDAYNHDLITKKQLRQIFNITDNQLNYSCYGLRNEHIYRQFKPFETDPIVLNNKSFIATTLKTEMFKAFQPFIEQYLSIEDLDLIWSMQQGPLYDEFRKHYADQPWTNKNVLTVEQFTEYCKYLKKTERNSQ